MKQVSKAQKCVRTVCTSQSPNEAHLTSTPRRSLLLACVGAALWSSRPDPSLAGLFGGKSPLQTAFEKAMSVQDNPVALEAAWTEALAIAPTNAALLSNRGTARLSLQKYAEALEDLEKAKDLEVAAYGYSSGFVLVALGNARGGLGDWQGAVDEYEEALMDEYPGISTLALGSLAVTRFQLGQDKAAVIAADKAFLEAPEYQDLQAAMAGILWVTGDEAGARERAQQAGGKGSVEQIYTMQKTANGWPPRTMEAVAKFISES
eukprot:CAMPEP_0196594320 /NCGR_PEP_ID=MMETSP1081-20130531/78006_1 /TAXON_ID=36882 /ORGANISM="Pyramimonas amylifera, Strain CCMP720" /LENGTH=262 /DNA_ID=CAMNT_0041918555 /DNA_START=162 /DNA_END=950 /DNA_ORIENTATION=+